MVLISRIKEALDDYDTAYDAIEYHLKDPSITSLKSFYTHLPPFPDRPLSDIEYFELLIIINNVDTSDLIAEQLYNDITIADPHIDRGLKSLARAKILNPVTYQQLLKSARKNPDFIFIQFNLEKLSLADCLTLTIFEDCLSDPNPKASHLFLDVLESRGLLMEGNADWFMMHRVLLTDTAVINQFQGAASLHFNQSVFEEMIRICFEESDAIDKIRLLGRCIMRNEYRVTKLHHFFGVTEDAICKEFNQEVLNLKSKK